MESSERILTATAPGLLILGSIFGATETLSETARHFELHGYLTQTPDVFRAAVPGALAYDEPGRRAARERRDAFDLSRGLADLQTEIDTLRADPGCNGKVGVLGYGFGGRLAYLSITRLDADAAVAIEPTAMTIYLDEGSRATRPLGFHFGDDDALVPFEDVRAVKGTLEGIGTCDIYRYPHMAHGFATRGHKAYDADAAALVEKRALAKFDEALR